VARFVALLRGINVGGNKRVPMVDLRDLLVGLGYTDVATLLQSGNAVFTSPGRRAASAVRRSIEQAIEARFGFPVRVLVRTSGQLAATVASNPLPVPDGSRFLVWFLDDAPDLHRFSELDPAEVEPERFAVGDNVIYVWCANGILDSQVLAHVAKLRLSLTGTTRNWNTVTKLNGIA
jgi:uncharacterized protein (DUF1697 family)